MAARGKNTRPPPQKNGNEVERRKEGGGIEDGDRGGERGKVEKGQKNSHSTDWLHSAVCNKRASAEFGI